MTRYEILFFRLDGSEAMRKVAECADDREARILAHALWEKGMHGLRVYRLVPDHPKIYQRPEYDPDINAPRFTVR